MISIASPKLFYVSTSTTTSTQKSLTFCFQRITASFALQRCTGRRKRRDIEAIISASEGLGLEGADRIQPTPKVPYFPYLVNAFLSVVGCSPKHVGWKSRRAWRQRRKRGKIWCPFSSCCSDTNAKVRYMNYWMTTTTTLTSISYTATSTFASIICSPTGFTHVTCPSGWRKNLRLCLLFGLVLLKNIYTRTLHIVFVCVRDSFAVAGIYQDDFEKVSIKPLGLKKGSKTSILHSIGKPSFERRKKL